MIVVLDSNEYINFLNRKDLSLVMLIRNRDLSIHINELIVREVLRNVDRKLKSGFYRMLLKSNVIVNDEKLPSYLFEKYRMLGLKKGDIAIAAFCEASNADYLVSENRHFLQSKRFEGFRVLKLQDFVRVL